MVRLWLAGLVLLAGALRADAGATAQPLTETPVVELKQFEPEPNRPVEDFFTVTIISLPFTAIWSFVGATAIASVAQGQFLPEYDDRLLIAAGATAAGLSVGIGLFSVSWGPGKAPAKKSGPSAR